MKKIITLSFIGIAALVSSCGKSYTCTCVVTTMGVTHAISSDYGVVSKGDAESRCSDMQLQYVDSANSVSSDCHL